MRKIKQSTIVEGSNILYRVARDNLSDRPEGSEGASMYIHRG